MAKTIKPSAGNSRLRIGFVFDDSLDKNDGVQQYVLGLGAYYTSLGHEVHYLVGQTERRDLPRVHSLSKNIGVSFNGNKMSMPLLASKRTIKKLFAEISFDVLHVQMPHSPFMAQRVINAAPSGTFIIGTFHILPNSKLVILANKYLKLLLRSSLKRIDRVVSVSPAAQKFLRASWHINSVVVPNHTKTEQYLRAQPHRGYAHSCNIVFLGRLVERKGCQQLLSAIKQMIRLELTKQPFKVVICGKGPLMSRLQSYVGMNGMDHIVSFVGFVDEQEKPSYLAAADIAVFPATGGESFGIVLLEAMAASRGVVLGGNNPGYQSVLGGHDGQLFDPNDTHEFAQLLAAYLSASQRREAARQWQTDAVQAYDVSVVGSRLLHMYRA
ncbi:MAG: glycosyltransferase family 4 protein [Candidatus Saccharimonadales bacterium]